MKFIRIRPVFTFFLVVITSWLSLHASKQPTALPQKPTAAPQKQAENKQEKPNNKDEKIKNA